MAKNSIKSSLSIYFTFLLVIFVLIIVLPITFLNLKITNKYNNTVIKLNSYFDGGLLLEDTNLNDLDNIKKTIMELPVKKQKNLNIKLNEAYRQYESMASVKRKIALLFTDSSLTIVNDNVTTKERYNIYVELSNIKQKDFVYEQTKYLDLIDQKLLAKNSIEITGIPFISQEKSKIFNGCEAACLLMSLNYRNKLTHYNLHKFVLQMPKDDIDPHKGFIYSIYNYEPMDVPHWIAPDALAKFGSNYSNTKNISNSSIEQLKKHLLNNTPVIVYVTARFEEPTKWVGEVPVNLHVVLLIGYNENSYIVIDPYNGRQLIDKEKFERIYNLMKFSVVVE